MKILESVATIMILVSMLTVTAISDGDGFLTSTRIDNAPIEETYIYTPHYSTEWQDNFSIDMPLTEKHTEQAVVTAYCPCVKCCGKWSSDIRGGVPTTASGTHATAGRTCGADPNLLPYGTHIWIDGHEYVVEDTGSGLTKGMLHIDIYCNTHEEALQVGYSIREVSWETIAE